VSLLADPSDALFGNEMLLYFYFLPKYSGFASSSKIKELLPYFAKILDG